MVSAQTRHPWPVVRHSRSQRKRRTPDTRLSPGRFPWHVLLPFGLFVLHSLPLAGWLVDDAAISFAYTRNLVHGHGLIAQVGAEPVEGFSNPLWTFLVAPAFLGDPNDPTPIIKLISLMLTLGTFFVVDRICRTLVREAFWGRLASAGACLLLAVNTSFVAWTNSGLENALYALLAGVCCLLCVRHVAAGTAGTPWTPILAGLVGAGLALTRPEGILYGVVFATLPVWQVLAGRAQWRSALRNLVVYLLALLPPVLLYAGFRYAYFGDWLPNTYYAKQGTAWSDVGRLLLLTREHRVATYKLLASLSWLRAEWLLLVLLACLVLVGWRSPRRRLFVPVGLALLCAWVIYCLLPIDWMAEYRFATPFFMLFYVLLAAGGTEMVRTWPGGSPGLRKRIFAVCLAGMLAQSAAVFVPRTRAFAARPTAPFADVATTALTFNEYAAALGIVDGSLLCPDVGGVYYFSQLRVYDLGGLCDRTIGRLLDRDAPRLRDHILEHLRPTFICLHDSWCVRTGLQRDPRFWQQYVPIRQGPCDWAERQGDGGGFFDGDYVRRDAVVFAERLEQLRQRVIRGTVPADLQSARLRAVPFPRRSGSLRGRLHEMRTGPHPRVGALYWRQPWPTVGR